jgi:hypothetical protein
MGVNVPVRRPVVSMADMFGEWWWVVVMGWTTARSSSEMVRADG